MYPENHPGFFNDYYYTFTKGILINACMWKTDNSYGAIIPLIQIYKNTDTEWIIKVISVSVSGSSASSSLGLNTKITIYYI